MDEFDLLWSQLSHEARLFVQAVIKVESDNLHYERPRIKDDLLAELKKVVP